MAAWHDASAHCMDINNQQAFVLPRSWFFSDQHHCFSTLPFSLVQLSSPQYEYFPAKFGLQIAQVAQVAGSSQVVCHLAPTAICQVAGSDRGPRLGEKSVDLTKRSFSELFQILSRFCQKLELLYLISVES